MGPKVTERGEPSNGLRMKQRRAVPATQVAPAEQSDGQTQQKAAGHEHRRVRTFDWGPFPGETTHQPPLSSHSKKSTVMLSA